ncbi:hypothetical protein ACFL27_04165 [candidate division CSSED10-310 bacterium]|uniref:ABC transporter permease n=1 Tax=candidate division CSSED10-310 bacterium TaxID=2855610 RepID=A0ABV6YT49_UNCC1
MNRALFELQLLTIRGRFRRSLKLLRQPKYLIGSLLGLFFFILFYQFIVVSEISEKDKAMAQIKAIMPLLNSPATTDILHLLTSLLAAVGFLLLWIFLPGRLTIKLNDTEFESLQPAPLSKRSLIHYSLLKGQPQILFGALSFMVVFSFLSHKLYWILLPLYWILMTLVTLHIQLIMVLKGRLKKYSSPVRWAIQLLFIVSFVLYLYLLSVPVTQISKDVYHSLNSSDGNLSELVVSGQNLILGQCHEGYLTDLLSPFLMVTLPFFKSDQSGGLLTWIIPVALIFLHFRWVVRLKERDGRFAVKQAFQQSQSETEINLYMKSFLHGSAQSRPFNLSAVGKPEFAIFWKTFLLVYRTRLRTLFLYGSGAFFILLIITTALGVPKVMIGLEWVLGLIITINIIFLNVGNDLHYDLKKLEMVRTWPLPGYKFLAAKSLAVALLTTLHAFVGLGLMLTAYYSIKLHVLTTGVFSAYHFTEVGFQEYFSARGFFSPIFHMLAFVPLITSVSLLYCMLQNLSILLFPGWVAFSEQNQGLAMTGLSIFMAIMLIVLLLVGLIPGGVIIGCILFVQHLLNITVPLWEYLVFGLILVTALLGESALLIRFSGRLWDRLDLSQEIR